VGISLVSTPAQARLADILGIQLCEPSTLVLVLVLLVSLLARCLVHLPLVLAELFLDLFDHVEIDLVNWPVGLGRLLDHAPVLGSKGDRVVSPQLDVLHLLSEPQDSRLPHELPQRRPFVLILGRGV